MFFAWLFICSWHAFLGLPSQPRPGQSRAGQTRPGLRCSYCLHASNLSLAINLGPHTRDSDSSSRAGRIPNWQLATGCHAMTITSCSSYSNSPSSSSSRLLIRATCHACQRGQGCVLLQRIVAAASRCILTLMRRALAQLMTHPYQWSLPPPPPVAAPLLNATTDYQSGQVALQQRIKSLRFTFIWMGHLKGQRQLPTAT